MDADKISKILEYMGAEKIRPDENNVHSSCPLAPWKHEDGIDRRPSFGVKVNRTGLSGFNCFSCGLKGKDFKTLVWRWMEFSGKTSSSEVAEWIQRTEYVDLTAEGGAGLIYDLYPEMRKDHTLPEEWWGPFQGSVPQYLLDRGITLETAKTWGLGHDRERHRLMFAVRNERGELCSIIGRKIHNDAPGPKYWSATGMKKGRHLYGENMMMDAGKVVVVEGTMDVLWTWQCGIRDVAAILGSALTKDQARTLIKWNHPIYLFLDNNMAGIQGQLGAINTLEGQVPIFVVKYPEGKKEPTDFSREEVINAILTAQLGDVWKLWAERYVEKIKAERRRKKEELCGKVRK